MKNIEFDFPKILDVITGLDEWEQVEIQEADTGITYFYKTKDGEHEAEVIIDQDCMTVIVDGQDMYSGEYMEDESLTPFIKSEG